MMGGRSVAPPLVLALVTIAIAVATPPATAAASQGEVKCAGCSPCGGADCPVLYPSPPPPPYYYYSPPPPAAYPGESSYYTPPPPGAYIQIGSAPPGGKGPLYPQDPGFIAAGAPGRVAPLKVAALAALAGAWAIL